MSAEYTQLTAILILNSAEVLYSNARCKSSLLWRNFYNAILASDSEPDIFVSGEAGHEQRMLALYRSPRKDVQIVGWEWIQTLIALEKIGTFAP